MAKENRLFKQIPFGPDPFPLFTC